MRRLLVGSFSLLLIAGATCPTIAQTGVSLGRPQAIALDAPSPVQLAVFASPQPVFQGQPAGPIQQLQPGVSPSPSAAWGSAFAVEGKQAPAATGPAAVRSDLPPPTPLPSPTPFAVPDFAPDTIGMGCCPMDGCGHSLGCLCPSNWCNCLHCIPWQQFYASADYLMWWMRGANSPPLVSTGILGAPGTSVLFGGPGALTKDMFSGGRFTLGYWFDPERTCGIETDWLFLGQRSAQFATNSAAFPTLVRPFISLNTGGPAGEVVTAPGGPGGGVAVRAPSSLWGGEINMVNNLFGDASGWPGRLNLLVGFRFLELQEDLNIAEFSDNAGNLRVSEDHFGTHNEFYGTQLGLDWTWRCGRWSIDMRAKVAMGDTVRTVNINGATGFFAPGGAATGANGGLLALPSNIGRTTRSCFGVVPEAGINVGYQVTDNLRLYVGYSFLYWANVYRPGDQVDPVIDASQIPGAVGIAPAGQNRPKVLLHGTGFWAQGMNCGLQYRY
jgi:hypothetical protein